MTLVALAEACELSHPFLSQVENARAEPSMDSLRRIAVALGTTPQALFETDGGGGEPVVVRRAEAPTLAAFDAPGNDFVRLLLGGDAPFHLVELDGLPQKFEELWSHDGHEAVYVVRGAVEIELDGSVTSLRPGDTVSYPAVVPHRLRATGRARAAVLLIESPLHAGEVAHAAS